MKVTYNAPNRSHHYEYANALNRVSCLNAFVNGFSRFSPRANYHEVGHKLIRFDYVQNLYLASLKMRAPWRVSQLLANLSGALIDYNSFRYAQNSDVFLFYRSHGYRTCRKLKARNLNVLCVMEEVNSHVLYMQDILKIEYEEIYRKPYVSKINDVKLRLKSYEIADKILCPSKFVLDSFIEKGFDPNKMIKINFGIKHFNIQQSFERDNRKKFEVLYVGQLHYRKGLRYAIEAFSKLKHPNKVFRIVGPLTKETGLENLSIPDGVIFEGVLKGDALIRAYDSANLFVLPTLEEGLALVQGEALSRGLPVLTTTNSGGSEWIENGKNGFIVQTRNSDEIYEKMALLADSPLALDEMQFLAIKKSKELRSWDDVTEELLSELSNFTSNF